MLKDPRKPLKDAIENVDYLLKKTNSITKEILDTDIDLKNAISFSLLILGEALNRLKKNHDLRKEIYDDIIELSNSIKHNYWKNRNRLILDIIKEDFIELKGILEDDLIKFEIDFK